MSSQVSGCRITRASEDDRRRGLLAYCSLTIGPYEIDGLTVRRTASGKVTVSYPARRGRDGRQHAYFFPSNAAWREDLEREILTAYWAEVGEP